MDFIPHVLCLGESWACSGIFSSPFMRVNSRLISFSTTQNHQIDRNRMQQTALVALLGVINRGRESWYKLSKRIECTNLNANTTTSKTLHGC